jgi:hypothetical protein
VVTAAGEKADDASKRQAAAPVAGLEGYFQTRSTVKATEIIIVGDGIDYDQMEINIKNKK